jgi:hypothetical protein
MQFLCGDINESFNLMIFDSKKNRFEIQAADLSLQSLYKGILLITPVLPYNGKENVLLLEKTGCLSRYTLKEEVYKVVNCIDTKEFINRCHIQKPL